MITSLGSASLAVLVPGAAAEAARLVAACGIAAPNVEGQLSAIGTFTPQVQMSYPQQLAIAQQIVSQLQALIAAGLEPPDFTAQVVLAGQVHASLYALLSAVQGYLSASIGSLLATAGVSGYVFDGPKNTFGGELATALGAGTESAHAIVLLTSAGATWTAMQSLFKTS